MKIRHKFNSYPGYGKMGYGYSQGPSDSDLRKRSEIKKKPKSQWTDQEKRWMKDNFGE